MGMAFSSLFSRLTGLFASESEVRILMLGLDASAFRISERTGNHGLRQKINRWKDNYTISLPGRNGSGNAADNRFQRRDTDIQEPEAPGACRLFEYAVGYSDEYTPCNKFLPPQSGLDCTHSRVMTGVGSRRPEQHTAIL